MYIHLLWYSFRSGFHVYLQYMNTFSYIHFLHQIKLKIVITRVVTYQKWNKASGKFNIYVFIFDIKVWFSLVKSLILFIKYNNTNPPRLYNTLLYKIYYISMWHNHTYTQFNVRNKYFFLLLPESRKNSVYNIVSSSTRYWDWVIYTIVLYRIFLLFWWHITATNWTISSAFVRNI